jgi:uncharacterized protein (UPF0332 family)
VATWRELALDSRRAAQDLLEQNRIRSSISRAYYAAYCAITAVLAEQGVDFAFGGNNPPHADLPIYILHNLPRLPKDARYILAKAIRRLWKVRVDADYVPTASLDRIIAIDALRDANRIILELEKYHD